jgi:hypothetical protein
MHGLHESPVQSYAELQWPQYASQACSCVQGVQLNSCYAASCCRQCTVEMAWVVSVSTSNCHV